MEGRTQELLSLKKLEEKDPFDCRTSIGFSLTSIGLKQYIYMVTPPPHDPPTSILYGNYQCFMHIFFYQKNDILMFLFLLLTT